MEGRQQLTDEQVNVLLTKSGQQTQGLARNRREYVKGQLLQRAQAYPDEAENVNEALRLDNLRRTPFVGRLLVALMLMQTRKK